MLTNFELNNLMTYRGDDLDIGLTFTDTDEIPIDITGWTLFFTMKNTKDDPDDKAVLQLNILPNEIVDPTEGQATFHLSNLQTVNFKGSYWYDIQIKKADNTIQTVTNGNINFQTDATQRTTP